MEAVRDFIACEDAGRGTDPARQSGAAGVNLDRSGAGRAVGVEGVAGVLAALEAVSATAAEDAACWDLRAASDFAGQVEEISRTLEYLQLVAAGGCGPGQESRPRPPPGRRPPRALSRRGPRAGGRALPAGMPADLVPQSSTRPSSRRRCSRRCSARGRHGSGHGSRHGRAGVRG